MEHECKRGRNEEDFFVISLYAQISGGGQNVFALVGVYSFLSELSFSEGEKKKTVSCSLEDRHSTNKLANKQEWNITS